MAVCNIANTLYRRDEEFGNRNVWNNAGVIVNYQFDDNGHVLSGTWTEGTDAWTSNWSYDNAGNLTQYITRKNGQVQTELRNECGAGYDPHGRIGRCTSPPPRLERLWPRRTPSTRHR